MANDRFSSRPARPRSERPGGRPDWSRKATAPARSLEDPDAEVWLFGIHAVEAALANPARAKLRLVASRNAARNLESRPVEPEILEPDKIAALLPGGAVHQGLALLTRPLPDAALEDAALPADPDRPVVLLDQVTDPQNVGAILRSGAALGARAVITTFRHSPPVTGTLAKAATGAVEHLPYIRGQNLARSMEDLREAGYRLIGLAEEGGTPLTAVEADAPLAICLGAEGKGLRARTRDLCDQLVHLPTAGPISSLNVSNAAAIALYHVAVMRARG